MTSERKWILGVGAFLLFLGAIYRFFPPLEGYVSVADEIAVKQKQVEEFRNFAKQRERLSDVIISMNRRLERAESGLLEGRTVALAAVDIQNILNDIAARSGIEIQQMRVLEPGESEKENTEEVPYLQVPVQSTFKATIDQMKELLYLIQSSSKILKVDEFRARLINVRQWEQIYITMTVIGLMKRADQT